MPYWSYMKTPTLEDLLPKAKQLSRENEFVSPAFFQRILKIPLILQ
jgi:hypothetical protein